MLLYLLVHKMVILCFASCILRILLLLLCDGIIQHSPVRWQRYRFLGLWYACVWCLHFRRKRCACIQTLHSYLGRYLLLHPLYVLILLLLLAIQHFLQERDCSLIHTIFLHESLLCYFLLHLRKCVSRRTCLFSLEESIKTRNCLLGGKSRVA